MRDIVERLRFRADENYEMLGNIHEPLLEAADTITALRAENERLRAIITRVYQSSAQKHIIELTRAALEEKK